MCNLIIARKSLCRERFVSTQLNYEHNYQNRFSSPLSLSCYVLRPACRKIFMWRYLNTFALSNVAGCQFQKSTESDLKEPQRSLPYRWKFVSLLLVSQGAKSSSKQVRRYKQIRLEVAHKLNKHLDLCSLATISGQFRCLWVS